MQQLNTVRIHDYRIKKELVQQVSILCVLSSTDHWNIIILQMGKCPPIPEELLAVNGL